MDTQARCGEPVVPEVGPETRSDQLEQHFILEYLKSKGHTPETARALPEAEAKHLLAEASQYASARLAEIETRAHFVEEVHGA